METNHLGSVGVGNLMLQRNYTPKVLNRIHFISKIVFYFFILTPTFDFSHIFIFHLLFFIEKSTVLCVFKYSLSVVFSIFSHNANDCSGLIKSLGPDLDQQLQN